MRELQHQTPSLFDIAPPPEIAERPPVTEREEKGNDRHARDFVKWCFSLGSGFRNSPDIANLRFWTRKMKLKVKEKDEAEIIQIAAALFLKRLEQLLKRTEPSN